MSRNVTNVTFLTCYITDVSAGSTTSSSTLQNEAELGDDDVFTVSLSAASLLVDDGLLTHNIYRAHRK